MNTDPSLEELKEEPELDEEKGGIVEAVEITLTYCLYFVPNLLFSSSIGAFFGIRNHSFWWGTLAFFSSFILLFVPSQYFAERKIKS